jgi:hypothetical protein
LVLTHLFEDRRRQKVRPVRSQLAAEVGGAGADKFFTRYRTHARRTRTEHRQVVVDIEVRPPLIDRVLVVARLTAALGADKRGVGERQGGYSW